jgi:hypothetical protein
MKRSQHFFKILIFAALMLPPSIASLFAQIERPELLPRLFPSLSANGLNKKNAWAGGLNAPQWNDVDLNNDGQKDLVVFDRVGDKILTFLYSAANGYVFAPQFAENFPPMTDFALLRDFNNDGASDIFTFNNDGVAGIRVFKGKFVNGKLTFSLIRFQIPIGAEPRDILAYRFYTGRMVNLYVNSTDIPAIDDIDGDGDLDILTFNTGGGNIQFFANRSIERGFARDTLIYELFDDCWGRAYDNGGSVTVTLSPRADSCVQRFRNDGGGPVAKRHPGSSICTFDKDGDGDKEVLLGNVSFDKINQLTNGGSRTSAYVTAQDINFPSNSEGVNIFRFPAAYHLDLDNDGKKDIIVSPNSINFVENQRVAWFYKNIGTNQYVLELSQKDFLVDGMLDLGNGANPAFADVDADGDLDLVVGNHARFLTGNRKETSLYLLRNIGNATNPMFRLDNSDWLNMKQFSNEDVTNFAPTFGDLDNDGDLDLLIGEETGTLFYLQNTAAAGQPMQFATPIANYKNIVTNSAKPQIIDLDGDGKRDIVVGTLRGRLHFFKNIGTPNAPNFLPDPTNEQIGGVYTLEDTTFSSFSGSCAPFFLQLPNNKTFLITGSESGALMVYDSIAGNRLGNWRLRTSNYRNTREGLRTSPTLADLNGDGKLELVVGNLRGGLSFFSSDFNVDGRIGTTDLKASERFDMKLFPNPTENLLQISVSNLQNATPPVYRVINALGQVVLEEKGNATQHELNVSQLSAGFYVLECVQQNQIVAREKFVKK